MRRARGKALEPEQAADPRAARAAAVTLLARRDFASGELAAKLASQGYEAQNIAALVQELTDKRMLNDARYAENFVSYHAARGQGPQRIRQLLKAQSLAEALIDAVLEGGPDWRALARTVRQRKFGATAPKEWSEKSKQARFLQYRGFSTDHIRAALGRDFDPEP
jgi:regulatory protein